MNLLQKFPKPLRSFYVVFGLFALVWMAFFDKYNIPGQISQSNKNKKLEEDLRFYREETDRLMEVDLLLNSDPDALERYAREEYYMHREGEDVFVIVEK